MMPRLIRFLLSGGSAAAVEYLVFIAMQTAFGGRLVVSQSGSFACGFVVSFLLNRRWVFRSEGTWTTELARYGALAATNLVLSNLALVVLADHLHLHVLLAKFIVMAMIAAWNYLVFSRLVFRPSSGAR